MDMLSAQKVRLHGMTDPRWTTRDKITQYKGLINLYKRDTKISNLDKSMALKKEKRAINEMKKKIAKYREKLDYAIYGDRQIVRNELAKQKSIKLAYERLEPEVIVERIGQQNFDLRKKLDLLKCDTLQKAQNLVDKKVLVSVLRDRLIYEIPGSLPVEIRCRELTAFVQDVILRTHSAIVVNAAYGKIIDVMKNDQMYFDQILYSLKLDSKKQAKCMYDTIVLGQLAMEYLDDRKTEYNTLEEHVYEDITMRRRTVKSTRQVVESLAKNIKYYIRRDSDINLPEDVRINTNASIQSEIDNLSKTMNQLTVSFAENSYMQLYDLLQRQENQVEFLLETYNRGIEGKETMDNKVNHANLMYHQIINSGTDGLNTLKNEEDSIQARIEMIEKGMAIVTEKQEQETQMLLKIKVVLQHIEQTCKVVSSGWTDTWSLAPTPKTSSAFQDLRLAEEPSRYRLRMEEAIDIKNDCTAIVEILMVKIKALVDAAEGVEFDEISRSLADVYLQKMMLRRSKSIISEERETIESLIDVIADDAGVPTRAEIKAESKQIYATAKAEMDMAYTPGLKKKF